MGGKRNEQKSKQAVHPLVHSWGSWMLAFHPVTWNILLVAVPDIAQAMQVPTGTWMSVMSQSSTNTAIVIWCIAAAVYEISHTQ